MLSIGLVKRDRYIIDRIIGRGGTSCVYLVRDIHIGKRWALKEIYNDSKLSYKLAARETEILKSIDFPLFPRIVDAWQENEAIYIVSDYVEGTTLERLLRNIKVDKQQASKWALSIAEGLSYLHGLSPPILYLDLKPDNIVVKPDGSIKLIDFGISARITGHVVPMGTPGYAAPEQYEDEGIVNEQTDIYALGMTYYAMRHGTPIAPSVSNNLERIKNSNILDRKEKSFLLKCIAKEQTNRYDSIEYVTYQLKHFKLYPITRVGTIKYLVVIVFLVIVALSILEAMKIAKEQKQSAKEMVQKANVYMEDGEYTLEGIKIITAFINSGCLNESTKQEFSYEVAINYFEVQRDYTQAYKYFAKLDLDKYPDAECFMAICKLHTKINYDGFEMKECLGRLYKITKDQPPSKRKYHNILLVASGYEECEEDSYDGIEKAVTVVDDGIQELKSLSKQEDYASEMIIEYEARKNILYKKAQIKNKGKVNI